VAEPRLRFEISGASQLYAPPALQREAVRGTTLALVTATTTNENIRDRMPMRLTVHLSPVAVHVTDGGYSLRTAFV